MSTRIIAAVNEKNADRRSFLSLYFKVAVTILLALVLLSLLSVAMREPWFVSSPFGAWLGNSMMIGTITIPAYYMALALLIVFCFGLILFDIHTLYMRPIGTLHAWARAVRGGTPAIMPQFANDEIGSLAREVSSLAASYAKTRETNADLSGQKALFTTIMAHQLRTPLTGLMWNIDSLLKPETTEDERKKILPDVDILLKRMRLIINHILATADIDNGQFGFVMHETDLAPLVQQLVDDFNSVTRDRGLTIHYDHPQELPKVFADSERISIALFDLLSNAIDYTPSGGTVTVTLAPAKDAVSVSVADTGIGIPSSEMPLIFTKFYRGESARHMHADGSGLGLYLAKEIITSHGSEITVQSNSKGSRFSFYLSTKKPS